MASGSELLNFWKTWLSLSIWKSWIVVSVVQLTFMLGLVGFYYVIKCLMLVGG